MTSAKFLDRALPGFFPAAGVAAALLVVVLQGVAIERQSLVGDAAYHLLAGHQALRYGENTLNLEHPPLVKLVAALPLLAEEPLAPRVGIEDVLTASQHLWDDPARAGRVRRRSRILLLAVFGLPFLAACYGLGHALGGRRLGTVLALSLGLAFPVLPDLAILQTDAAVACGAAVLLLAALRYLERPGAGRAALVGLGLGLALASKHSGVLFVPTVILAAVLAGRPWLRRLRDLAVAGAFALALLWSTYAVANRAYDPAAGRDTIHRYCQGEALIVGDRMQPYEDFLLGVERIDPGLAQYLTGLIGIRIQSELGVYPTFAFGSLSTRGRWWYFPAVLAIQTPLVILLATALAFWRRPGSVPPLPWGEGPGVRATAPSRGSRARSWLLVFTAGLFLLAAMTSGYNLGIRHLLPILPLLFLPAAAWAALRRWRAVVLVGVLAVESVTLAPLWMSATNTWWLGAANPTRFALSLGAIEYRQDFLALADAARERGIERLHVLYPLISEAEVRASVPQADLVSPERPLEPGWYAVNVTVEQYLPAIERMDAQDLRGAASLRGLRETWEPSWRTLVEHGEDHSWVAGTFHLYRLTQEVGTLTP